MDPRRFDTLVRAFAAGSTRRRLVAVLSALPLVGVLTGVPGDVVEAERPGDRLQRRKAQRRRKQRNTKNNNNGKNNNGNNNKKNNKKNQGGGLGDPQACALNGQACQQSSDCCKDNCFAQVCADPPNRCDGKNCPNGSTGCCGVDGCCASPANQCNAGGLCCAPNCGGKQCGPDGCGNTGTCGSCAPGQTCNQQTAQCEGAACNAQSCPNGCCDGNGVCQPGTAHDACGTVGQACTACSQFQFCSAETRTCRDTPPCSAETCPNGCCEPQENGPDICRTGRRGCGAGAVCCNGCCDGNGECQPGTDGGACGVNGSTCIQCPILDPLCDQGRCQCDATNCPNGCCSNGPGHPGLCFVDDPRFCGTNGVTCAACADGLACNAQQQCVCTAQSCLPSTGRSCQGNQCLCDGGICDGCCGDGLCKPGNTVQACAKKGADCAVCKAGDICVSGTCCPAGTLGACDSAGCCPLGTRCCADDVIGSCCPTDQVCAGSSCCNPDATLACHNALVGWECCDPPDNACCNEGAGGQQCCH